MLSDIKSALTGQSKSDFNAIMATFASVDKASISLRPVWARTIPSNPDAITLIKTVMVDGTPLTETQ